jgi:hypothetical protein
VSDERVFQILVNSGNAADDLRSLASWLGSVTEFAGRVGLRGFDPATSVFDPLDAVALVTVDAAEHESSITNLADLVATWHTERAIRNIRAGDVLSPVVVTVVFPSGHTVATEGE